jgi:hypothetical protein
MHWDNTDSKTTGRVGQQHIRRRPEVMHWDNTDSKTTGRVGQQHTSR